MRIVSLAPSDTQVLVALGLGRDIVGLDQYSYQLLQTLNLTSQLPGNVTVFQSLVSPNVSGILLLNPTVVVTEWGLSGKYIPQMQQAGLRVLITNSDYATGLVQIEEQIKQIATYFNLSSRGQELLNWYEAHLKHYNQTNVSVAVIVYVNPDGSAWVAGNRTFINDLITRAGAANSLANYSGWAKVTPSQIILAQPQVIIVDSGGMNYTYVMGLVQKYYGNTPAVKEGRVYVISGLATDITNQPSLLSVYAVELFHDIIMGNAPHYVDTSWVLHNLHVQLPIFSS